MPLPQLDTQKFIDELNALRGNGTIVRDELLLGRLRRQIDAVKAHDVMAHFAYLGSLLMVAGKYEAAIDAVRKSLNTSQSGERLPYNINTLITSGFFSEAAKYASQLSDEDVSSQEIAGNCVWCVLDFRRAMFVDSRIEIAGDALRVFDAHGVSSTDVIPMLDLAGELLRERGLLTTGGPSFFVYSLDKTMTIHLPVKQRPEVLAELEWEYSARLFATLPDSPHSFVHVGFCSGDH